MATSKKSASANFGNVDPLAIWPPLAPKLTPQAVVALTGQTLHFEEEPESGDDSSDALGDGGWNHLFDYFEFYGLRLPCNADAVAVLGFSRELQAKYAPAIQLVSQAGTAEVPDLQSKLTAVQKAYVIAAGQQDRQLAQTLARQVFPERARAMFLV
jgi:hypothetical protein